MPVIAANDGCLTVFNMFTTDTIDGQRELLKEMRDIIDNGNFTGWRSSTLHAGQDEHGTANYIQWRSLADLEARYAGEGYKNNTVPLFKQISTSVHLLKTEVVFSQHHPDLPRIEISPERDDYTVIIVMDVAAQDQAALVQVLGRPDEWIKTVPGYLSHALCRGIDGTFVVLYAQWESKERYDAFHTMPESARPQAVREQRAFTDTLITARRSNTYRVVHTRSAGSPAVSIMNQEGTWQARATSRP
ncbi:antibiotic biosynthesis monooxygenase family protein [Actinosynnema sp. NPDC047251]|uniref:Anthrone monooxygenase n=1 Tax=Saccharothrix espanaensis (strain ATCC 51144 / DSM 44229 / JCM 9112 / NBRC 15066 / NRRL 15764) TaxID=1179773 RepID=K0K352_SACES|nr:antibiotic biosynthesis monooxygenase family protein [Saccharothrix espanaensis]CCH32736.1 Anthrone monooxygenase [Saccharothrix espanaensis DSM 44229]